MTGARQFAADMILPRIQPPCRVLDVGAGDGWLTVALREKGCDVTAVDINPDRIAFGVHCVVADFRRSHQVVTERPFDVICAVFCLQHLLDAESVGWSSLRRNLVPDGRAFVVGRYRWNQDRESDRNDPLNGYNTDGITALAMASGLRVAQLDIGHYTDTAWSGAAFKVANVFCAELLPWA